MQSFRFFVCQPLKNRACYTSENLTVLTNVSLQETFATRHLPQTWWSFTKILYFFLFFLWYSYRLFRFHHVFCNRRSLLKIIFCPLHFKFSLTSSRSFSLPQFCSFLPNFTGGKPWIFVASHSRGISKWFINAKIFWKALWTTSNNLCKWKFIHIYGNELLVQKKELTK